MNARAERGPALEASDVTISARAERGPALAASDVTITICPGGPMLVRGAEAVVGHDGERHPVQRPVVAVCRCDKSGRFPWCDGTHKQLSPERRPDALRIELDEGHRDSAG